MLSRQCLLTAFLATAALTVAATNASAQRVEVTAQTIEASENGGVVDVKIRIRVINGETSPLLNLWAVFADQREVQIGDVEAEGSATSGEHTLALDGSSTPTRHHAVPIRLKFTHDGAHVEQERTLFVHLDVSGEEQ